MEPGTSMDQADKVATIKKWVDPEERVTVQFDDERDISAEIRACTEQLVDLALDTRIPHMRQHISVPLSDVELSEDLSHYTRDPDRPLKHRRLMLIIRGRRPPVIY
ncbi:MAG TPA: hypothetical protein VFS39_10320 [Nitrospira sp.]|nr:hypothetical protein [Nitrospira sp.]